MTKKTANKNMFIKNICRHVALPAWIATLLSAGKIAYIPVLYPGSVQYVRFK